MLKIASSPDILVPLDVVQLVAASPSEKCNDYSYMGNQIAPNVSDAKVTGPLEVDLNSIYGPWNKMDIKMGDGSSKPELKVTDKDGNSITLKARGRHDPCVLPRAVPIVDAMAAMVILDAYLPNKTTRL